MCFISRNAFTGVQVYKLQYMSLAEIHSRISKLHDYYSIVKYNNSNIRQQNLAKVFEAITVSAPKIAELISIETGKPQKQSSYEIKLILEDMKFYKKNMHALMKNKLVAKTNLVKTGYTIKPLGITYNVARRYFPFYSMMKLAIPNLVVGNCVLIRPDDTTPQVGLGIQEVLKKAQVESISVIFNDMKENKSIIKDKRIRAVSGFDNGSDIEKELASQAGKNLKLSYFEKITNNNLLIVLKDADLKLAVDLAYYGMLKNNGQCPQTTIKRVLISNDLIDKFLDQLSLRIKNINWGNPLEFDTDLGPLGGVDHNQNVLGQVDESIDIHWSHNYVGHSQNLCINYPEELANNVLSPTVIKINDTKLQTESTFRCPLWYGQVKAPTLCVAGFNEGDNIVDMANSNLPENKRNIVFATKDLKQVNNLMKDQEADNIYINQEINFVQNNNRGFVNADGPNLLKEFANVQSYSISE